MATFEGLRLRLGLGRQANPLSVDQRQIVNLKLKKKSHAIILSFNRIRNAHVDVHAKRAG